VCTVVYTQVGRQEGSFLLKTVLFLLKNGRSKPVSEPVVAPSLSSGVFPELGITGNQEKERNLNIPDIPGWERRSLRRVDPLSLLGLIGDLVQEDPSSIRSFLLS